MASPEWGSAPGGTWGSPLGGAGRRAGPRPSPGGTQPERRSPRPGPLAGSRASRTTDGPFGRFPSTAPFRCPIPWLLGVQWVFPAGCSGFPRRPPPFGGWAGEDSRPRHPADQKKPAGSSDRQGKSPPAPNHRPTPSPGLLPQPAPSRPTPAVLSHSRPISFLPTRTRPPVNSRLRPGIAGEPYASWAVTGGAPPALRPTAVRWLSVAARILRDHARRPHGSSRPDRAEDRAAAGPADAAGSLADRISPGIRGGRRGDHGPGP
ncbi:hypothetical protein BX264_1497 [Streptomyces sp. 2333.5]|nr:hypothetical protein BX264_1497 [Streptomyces sp. 2333.5]SED25552.1 hypothetical protein SAMN05428942_1513 [Streptomyces sp. 2112.2]